MGASSTLSQLGHGAQFRSHCKLGPMTQRRTAITPSRSVRLLKGAKSETLLPGVPVTSRRREPCGVGCTSPDVHTAHAPSARDPRSSCYVGTVRSFIAAPLSIQRGSDPERRAVTLDTARGRLQMFPHRLTSSHTVYTMSAQRTTHPSHQGVNRMHSEASTDDMTYSESAQGVLITRTRVIEEMTNHGCEDDLDELFATITVVTVDAQGRKRYAAADVLSFLGY